MASEGGLGVGVLIVLLFTHALRSERDDDERKVILESIDSKMHTHAADGSIQGIGGWY